jgi:hypothetical protein
VDNLVEDSQNLLRKESGQVTAVSDETKTSHFSGAQATVYPQGDRENALTVDKFYLHT